MKKHSKIDIVLDVSTRGDISFGAAKRSRDAITDSLGFKLPGMRQKTPSANYPSSNRMFKKAVIK